MHMYKYKLFLKCIHLTLVHRYHFYFVQGFCLDCCISCMLHEVINLKLCKFSSNLLVVLSL